MYARVIVPRRTICASCKFTLSSLSQAHPLGYLPSPQCAFQGHAAHAIERSRRLGPTTHGVPVYLKVVTTFLHNASRRTRRALHASCESPWHSLAKHCILDTCFLLTVPFRGMLLTPQGGPRCLAPTAHQIPVYLLVFSTFLCRAFTAHYLYTPRW